MRLGRLALLLATLVAVATPASAQRDRRGGSPGNFDFYVLALSWTPGFCALGGDERRDAREQCADGTGLGFVVHGLWPQYERGFPSDCSAFERSPSRIAMREADGLFPSEGLARYQWRKHGTCSGSSPAAYFADVRKARDKIAIPPLLTSVERDRTLDPMAIERAFTEANPGLRPDMMAVACRRGTLQEVRICLTRDLRGFRSCPEVDRAGCRTRDLRVDSIR
jgi:ribonuclease T2